MFETVRPMASGMGSMRSMDMSKMTKQPQTAAMPPVNMNVQSNDDVAMELNNRFCDVTEKAMRYYKTDIVPPTSNAQLLLAMKFFVYGFFVLNGLIFVVAFLIPARMDMPYGGLDIRDFNLSRDHLVILVIPFLILLVRCLAFSWSQEFYNYVVFLAFIEGIIGLATAAWWSPGLPLLFVLVISGLMNTVVVQWFFARTFFGTVENLQSLVPPTFKRQIDHTVLQEGAPDAEDCLRLFGYTDQTPAAFYRDRCGVYSDKTTMAHVTAMQNCYQQALDPTSFRAQWKRAAEDLMYIGEYLYADGILYLLCCYASSAFMGIWLGQIVFRDIYHGLYMLFTVSFLFVLKALAGFIINRRLGEALGVAVAEKEFMAHDVVRHDGEKAAIDLGYVDVSTSNGGNGPYFAGGYSMVGLETNRGMGGGRLNLTSMWLNVAATFDFVGASYLAGISSNIAAESKNMIEALSAFEFKQIHATRWELSISFLLNSIGQMFLFTLMCAMYFGTYFERADRIEPPQMLIIFLGGVAILCATVKVCEALRFAKFILDDTGATPRRFCVSETVMLAITLFLVVLILLFCYLMPIALQWDFPLGKCSNTTLYRTLFPSACARVAY